MIKKKMPRVKGTFAGQIHKLEDRIHDGGLHVSGRQVFLGHQTVKKKKFWMVRTSTMANGQEHNQNLLLLDDTLDALVKLYFEARGTTFIEVDMRITADAAASLKRGIADSQAGRVTPAPAADLAKPKKRAKR